LYGPANREETLILDDLLIGDDGPVAYGTDTPTHALMGRFGNVLLVNGAPRWSARAHRREVVRFFLRNGANTRTWNVSFGGRRATRPGLELRFPRIQAGGAGRDGALPPRRRAAAGSRAGPHDGHARVALRERAAPGDRLGVVRAGGVGGRHAGHELGDDRPTGALGDARSGDWARE